MIFRVRYELAGGHVYMRFFSGPHEGALGKCGNLCMRAEEFGMFRNAATFMQFVPEATEQPMYPRCSCGRAAMFHTVVARTVVGNKPVMGWVCESCAGKESANVAAS